MVIATKSLSRRQWIFLYALIAGLFFIQPFGSLILFLLICYAAFGQKDYIWNRNLLFFISLSILLLAIINSSKANDNDLFHYVQGFKESGKSDLLNFILHQKKKSEIAYTVYIWLINHIFGNNEIIFKFLTTVIQYIFLNIATLKFCNKITSNKAVILTAIILTCFNPYVFSLSIQLVRQSLSVCLFVYVMVERCIYNKTHWILIALCPLIHTMTLLLVILLFLPTLKKPIQKNFTGYSILLIVIASIRLISGYLLSLPIFNDSTASYALQRASADKVFNLGAPTLSTILLTIVIFATSFYCGQIQTKKQKNPKASGVRLLFNIPMTIAIFIMLNINLSEIFFRFLMLLYPFIPLIFVSLLKSTKINRQIFLFGSILLILSFIYMTKHNVWTYKNLEDITNSGLLYLV